MDKNVKNTAYIPPEGGWGYIIVCGMVIPMICGFGSIPSFGLIFTDFLNSTGASPDTIAVITSIFFTAFNFSGLFTNVLSKRFSMRSIALVGSVLYNVGSISAIFVNSKMGLLISYGVLQGTGLGIMVPISFAVFNSYFVKRRSFMMSLGSAVLGLGMTLYPFLAQLSKNVFGFRGCLILIAAMNMHTFIATLVMHPVQWHSRRVHVHNDSSIMAPNVDASSLGRPNTPIEKQILPVLWLLASPDSYRKKIVEFLDLNLMRDPIYVNIALGISFASFSDAIFVSIQPSYLMDQKYSNDDIATIIASGLAMDLVSRITYTLASGFIDLKPRSMFLFGVIFMFVARIAFSYVYEFTEVIVVNGVIGFFRAWIYITPNLIFAEYLPLSRFPSGFGLFMFIQGINIVVLGLFISWIQNASESFAITFWASHAVMLFCVLPWIIELINLRYFKSPPLPNM